MSQSSTALVRDALRALPQFQRIQHTDAQRWLKYNLERQPNRIMWLIERLGSGFGGSEVGILLLDAMGRQSPFSSAKQLVNEKLMRVLPNPTTSYMRKGTDLEEAVSLAVLRLYGGTLDNAHLNALSTPSTKDPFGVTGKPDFPWIQANGTRTLVDIKVPGSGEETLSSKDKDFLYCTQLNTYNLLNDARGLPAFDNLMNINLELPPVVSDALLARLRGGGSDALEAVVNEMVTLLKYEQPGLRLHFIEQAINPLVDFNGEQQPLNDLICSTAALHWQYVLDGVSPELTVRADKELSDDEHEFIRESSEQLIQLFALKAGIDDQIAACSERITSLCAPLTQEGQLSQSPHINIKQVARLDLTSATAFCEQSFVDLNTLRETRTDVGVRDYDTLAMANALREANIDLAPFIHPAPLDTHLVLDAIADAGENPARFVSHSTSITRSQKKVTKELMAELSKTVDALLPTLLSDFSTTHKLNREENTLDALAAPVSSLTHSL